eukprot:scaffold7114_cov264-Pinguiococcus_pyrenoidosus.AAC.1
MSSYLKAPLAIEGQERLLSDSPPHFFWLQLRTRPKQCLKLFVMSQHPEPPYEDETSGDETSGDKTSKAADTPDRSGMAATETQVRTGPRSLHFATGNMTQAGPLQRLTPESMSIKRDMTPRASIQGVSCASPATKPHGYQFQERRRPRTIHDIDELIQRRREELDKLRTLNRDLMERSALERATKMGVGFDEEDSDVPASPGNSQR